MAPPRRPARHRTALTWWRRRFGIGRLIASALLVLLLAVRVWDPPPVEALRLRAFDAYQTIKPRAPLARHPVVIVDLDEDSMRALGQWPWPRTRIAEMVRRLSAAGAVLIAFDIVFAEPDRLSPALLADALPTLPPDTRDALRAQPSNDSVLAEAMRGARVILGQTALATPVPWTAPEPPPQTALGLRAPAGVDAQPFLPELPGLLRNVPELEAAATGRGLFTIVPERDGIVRRVPLVIRADGVLVPTLTLEILRVLAGAPGIVVQADQGGIEAVAMPGFAMPTDAYGQVWIHFNAHDPARFVSARSVLDGSVPPERLAGKIVLVGTSAIGLLDNKTTPIDRSMPGVEVHAQLLEGALTGATLTAPTYATAVELVVSASVAAAIILFAPVLGALNLLFFGALVALFLTASSWWRFSRSGLLLDATFPLACSFLVYLSLVFTNYVREQLGRAQIRSAFGQYLSPALVQQLAHSPEKLKLGGEERVLTIMFSDVRGFTTISESYKHDPQGLTALMNRFLSPLTDAIIARKGTVDKYMGDAIMAFWNAPLDDPRQEENACQAALDMLARLARVNAEREAEAQAGGHEYLPLAVGIGLNTGRCVVGNMGSTLRFDYSALGDPVNLASRLEGQSKFYGCRIVLGGSTAAKATERFACLEVDLIRVKGKTEPETVWTLVGDDTVLRSPAFTALARRHGALLAAYRERNWPAALRLCTECRALAAPFSLEGLYDLYARRADAFSADPPPADWNGVYVATAK